jgi:hypothetical protein
VSTLKAGHRCFAAASVAIVSNICFSVASSVCAAAGPIISAPAIKAENAAFVLSAVVVLAILAMCAVPRVRGQGRPGARTPEPVPLVLGRSGQRADLSRGNLAGLMPQGKNREPLLCSQRLGY